jgi:hypothetical protein
MLENPLDLPDDLLSLLEKREGKDRRRPVDEATGKDVAPPEDIPGGVERRKGPRRAEESGADGRE